MKDELEEQKKASLIRTVSQTAQFINAIFSEKYQIILYGGAIRGGKTYAGLGALLLLSKFYPGSIWAVVRQSLVSLKLTTIKSFFKICPRDFIKNYNQETQTVTLKNGSQIIFWAENYDDDKELDRWKGLEVSGFMLEECNELQEVSFYKAIERAGSFIPRDKTKKMPAPIIIATCNPADNWVKALFYDRWAGINDAEPLPEQWLYIPAKLTDNPHNSKAYIESLKRNMRAFEYEVFVNGNWEIRLKSGGEYFKSFELTQHVRKDFIEKEAVRYNPNLPLHISWDDNVNPYLPVGIFQIEIDITTEMKTVKDKIVYKDIEHFTVKMIDEIAAKNPRNTVTAVCNEIIRKFPSHNAGIFIYGDATADAEDTKLEKGDSFYNHIMKDLDIYKPTNKVLRANDSVRMRANWMNTVFEKEVGNIKMMISDKCKTAVNDFQCCKEDENGGKAKTMVTDPKTKVRYQQFGHFCDLLEYFMCSRFRTEFFQWQAGGVVGSITYGRNIHDKHSYK